MKSIIKSFSVYGLFGTDDVHIPFDENVKILIGENGIGKTQILNLFYYTLTGNFLKLGEFHFIKLVLKFKNSRAIEIKKTTIDNFIEKIYHHPLIKDVINDIGYSQFQFLRNLYIQSKGDTRRLESQLENNFRLRKFSARTVFRVFNELDLNEENEKNPELSKCKREIFASLNDCDIMYFPTYRRVEEDLHILGYNDDENLNQESTLIQFGMNDVQTRFNKIENTIDKYLKEGFSNITSEILSQLVVGFPEIDNSFLNRINENDIEIILARVGKQLSDSDKNKIREMVIKKEFKNPSLTYFLQKLVEIYEKQKQLDNSVKLFRDVCNKYLVNKKVFYDESNIKINIKSDRNGGVIDLSKLSSGEKQIISMFAKIYLSDKDKRFMVLFDEPELSLSMPWQKLLLPDILNSKKCDFLLAVTHSPFIFDNELDVYAVGLNEYFNESSKVVLSNVLS